MTAITEAARQTPVAEDCDVVVCGGGPAGVAAALAAARAGARTRLIELHGSLGGIWTVGRMAFVCGMHASKNGILMEIVNGLKARNAVGLSGLAFDVEETKLLLEEMCLEAGVTIRLHTRVVDTIRNAENRITCAITESKSGREAWRAPVFIDCTGDGDLGARAGCTFSVGRPGSGETQPMSFIAVVTGIELEAIRQFTNARRPEDGQSRISHKKRLQTLLTEAGTPPSYSHPTLFHIHDNLFLMMSNHEYGMSGIDAD
ncbi:MAG: FAD-dependent oxidoreductase, partial [Lentisphaerae bacterium]|nr:FAD-dependent oxidoreductase [Lentisphaerota bacterium]